MTHSLCKVLLILMISVLGGYAIQSTTTGWTSCSLIQEVDKVYTTGLDDLPTYRLSYAILNYLGYNYTAECQLMKVPYVYNIIDKEIPTTVNDSNMTIFIKHYKLRQSTAPQDHVLVIYNDILYSNSYYAESVASLLLQVSKLDHNFLDIYVIDPRGTGRSTSLSCPLTGIHEKNSMAGCLAAEEEMKNCIEEINSMYINRDMRGNPIERNNSKNTKNNGTMIFSSIQSAFDFYFITNNLFINKNISIYANHGSTLILTHILQLYDQVERKNTIQSVIYDNALDINIHDKQTYIDLISPSVNKAGFIYFDNCLQFPICNKILVNDPQSIFDTLFDSTQRINCQFLYAPLPTGLGLHPSDITSLLSHILINKYTRSYLPQVITELLRCKSNDMNTLLTIIHSNRYVLRGTPDLNCDKYLLNRLNILFSELSNPSLNQYLKLYIRDLEDKENSYLFTFRYSRWLSFFPEFSRYDIPKEYLEYPKTNISLLFLTGSGPIYQTRQPRTVYSQIKAKYKYWINLSTSFSFTSLLESFTIHGFEDIPNDCGVSLLYSFIRDEPTKHDIDQSCLQQILYSLGYPESKKQSVSEVLNSFDLDAGSEYIQKSIWTILAVILSTSILCIVICSVPVVYLYLIYRNL